MARGINKVILVGNLGNDPETRTAPSGSTVTNISIATSESWKDKLTGEQTERTEWHRIVLFNRLGEIASQYLKKGSKVYIEGSLRTRKWQDSNGHDRYTTEIVASEMQMLDGKGSISSMPNSEVLFNTDDKEAEGTSQITSLGANTSSLQQSNFDDDIPF